MDNLEKFMKFMQGFDFSDGIFASAQFGEGLNEECNKAAAELAAMEDDLQQTVLAVGLHKEAERVLRERVEKYEEFVNDVSETLELHESHWNYHLHKDLADLELAMKGGER